MRKNIKINIKSLIDDLKINESIMNGQAALMAKQIGKTTAELLNRIFQESKNSTESYPHSDNRAYNPRKIDLTEFKKSLVDLGDQLEKLFESLKRLQVVSSTDQPSSLKKEVAKLINTEQDEYTLLLQLRILLNKYESHKHKQANESLKGISF